jgi:hypothetical protein
MESFRCRAECAHGIEPGDPEGHNTDANMTTDSIIVLSVTWCTNRHLRRYAFNQ